MRVYEKLDDLIGNTPIVKMNHTTQNVPVGKWLRERCPDLGDSVSVKSKVYSKVELFNPGGSVKDRIAKHIVNGLEQSGALKKGGTLVEATSGNTGAGLAMYAVLRGYKAILVMPDKISAEKINALRALGAKVVITQTAHTPDHPNYYTNVAKRLSEEIEGACLADQYCNQNNPNAHYESTGPEIWEQMEGNLDVFICGIGTGGTMTGTGRYLREKKPDVKLVAVDPYGSIYGGLIEHGKESEMHSYLVEGVGKDSVPDTMDLKLPDACVQVSDEESFYMTHILAQKEGLLVGGSCGSAYFGALQWLALHETNGGEPLNAVVLLPDSGSRYLSKVFNPEYFATNKLELASAKGIGEVELLEGAIRVEGI